MELNDRISINDLSNTARMVERFYLNNVNPISVPSSHTRLCSETISIETDNVPIFMMANQVLKPRGYYPDESPLDNPEKYNRMEDPEGADQLFREVYDNPILMEGKIFADHCLHFRKGIYIDEKRALETAVKLKKRGFNINLLKSKDNFTLVLNDDSFKLTQLLGFSNKEDFENNERLFQELQSLISKKYFGGTTTSPSGMPDDNYTCSGGAQLTKRNKSNNNRLYHVQEIASPEFEKMFTKVSNFNLELITVLNEVVLGKPLKPVIRKDMITVEIMKGEFYLNRGFYINKFPAVTECIVKSSQMIQKQDYEGIEQLLNFAYKTITTVRESEYEHSNLHDRLTFAYGFLIGKAIQKGKITNFNLAAHLELSNVESVESLREDIVGWMNATTIKLKKTDEIRLKDPSIDRWIYGGLLLGMEDQLLSQDDLAYALDTNPLYIRERPLGKNLNLLILEVTFKYLK